MNKFIAILVGLVVISCAEASDFRFTVQINRPTNTRVIYYRPYIYRECTYSNYRTVYTYSNYRTVYVRPERVYYTRSIRPIRHYYCY